MDERSEHVEDLPPQPPGGGRGGATSARRRARTVRVPDPGGIAGVPPVPDVLRGAVDPDTPFRRGGQAIDDAPRVDGWSWPAPPPPAVGPLPAPPPPRPVDPSASASGSGWHDLVGPVLPSSGEPLAAPRRRRPPWRLLAAAVVVVAAVLVGTAALDDDGGEAVVDGRSDAFAEQPALDEAP